MDPWCPLSNAPVAGWFDQSSEFRVPKRSREICTLDVEFERVNKIPRTCQSGPLLGSWLEFGYLLGELSKEPIEVPTETPMELVPDIPIPEAPI